MKRKKVICLTGSTRGKKTTSESMINYLAKHTPAEVELIKFRAYQIFADDQQWSNFKEELLSSDTLVVCAPLYIDSLPFPLLCTMERLAEELAEDALVDKEMLAIMHSGYPEVAQRKPSLDILRCFAQEMGLTWLGGIGFGGTSIIAGEPLEEMGAFSKWIRKALDDVSLSLTKGETISDQAIILSNKKFLPIPLWFMKILLNMRMKSNAKKNGVENIYAQPYGGEE